MDRMQEISFMDVADIQSASIFKTYNSLRNTRLFEKSNEDKNRV